MNYQGKLTLMLFLVIGGISLVSLLSILNYFDPYTNPKLGVSLLLISFIFTIVSFGSIFFVILKNIYYRGEIGIQHMFSSIRQSLFISCFIIILSICKFYGIPLYVPGFFSAVLLVLIELLIKNIKS